MVPKLSKKNQNTCKARDASEERMGLTDQT